MPARTPTSKRKSPPVGKTPSPGPKTKKRPTSDDVCRSTPPTTGSASLATRFISGLAAQLANDDERDTAVFEGAFRAALGVLPTGKLKTELTRDEAATVKRLAEEVRAIRDKHECDSVATAVTASATGAAQREGADKKGKSRVAPSEDGSVSGSIGGGGGSVVARSSKADIVPCTVQLYGRARALAEKNRDGINRSLLRALALNPRAPLDLLVDAMRTDSSDGGRQQATGNGVGVDDGGRLGGATALTTAVESMRNLVRALAADPSSAVSPSGLAFYTDRAVTLASSSARALTAEAAENRGRGGDGSAPSPGDSASVATSTGVGAGAAEALGLMLRILQLAGLASSSASITAVVKSTAAAADGNDNDDDNEDDDNETPFVDPADRLLLSCLPETSSQTAAPAAEAGDGGDVPTALPSARRSVARLLAHYAAAMAACSSRWKGGAAALIRSTRAEAAGTGRGGRGGSSNGDESSSDEESDEEEEEEEDGGGGGNGPLSRHLSTVCAGHLFGNETATLEFLRCVGDVVFVAPPPPPLETSAGLRKRLLPATTVVASALASMCARMLARLPRPSASPAPTASLFLRRAYAFRVVEALGQASGSTTIGDGGGASTVRPWDFVGAAGAPRALLDFLGRPEAPVAVGEGAARVALTELVSRRHSLAAVGELLRSSPACAPVALGTLLSAMERLSGGEQGGLGGETGADSKAREEDDVVVGGFFVDTAGGAAAGGGNGAGAVLAPLGGGGDSGGAADMDEEEEEEEP